MMTPFDFAWALLKADDDDRFPPMPWDSSTDQGYDPDRTQSKGGKVYHHPEPEHPLQEADEEMAPPPQEAGSAMAPDDKAQQVLASLSPEEQEALHRLLMGGGGQ